MTLREKYVTVAEAAEMMGKGINLVGKLCRAGRLPGAELMGTAGWLIPRESVLNYEPEKRGRKPKETKNSASPKRENSI